MRLDDEKYEEIKQTVIDTFEEYDVKSVPISAFEMAVKMGIRVVPYSSMGEELKKSAMKYSSDGYSTEVNNEWTIYYNDYCNCYGRINNTIMHEIGHFAMGHTEFGDEAEKEAEAKFFAKYALAPPPLIHNMVQPITPDTIMITFDISLQAAKNAYRYYKKWLNCGAEYYTDYETRMLELFDLHVK